jgi:hypothetical protein
MLFLGRLPNHGQGKAPRVMERGVAFSDQTIRVTIDDYDIVHMEIPTGDVVICMAFPVPQLYKNIAASKRALTEWERRQRQAKVVPIKGH